MAVNAEVFVKRRKPTDRNFFLLAAILFPLIVLIGYFKTYYFSAFFPDAAPVANTLVHAHGLVMSGWVLYFVAQVVLIRTKNIKLHMTMGLIGIALAALVVVVGMATAYDAQFIRHASPPGTDPHEFFILPAGDMAMFVLYFAGAVYFRKRPAEHKSLMLMTAINFLPAALFRIPFIPLEYLNLWAFGVPAVIAVLCLVWHSIRYEKVNKVFLTAVVLYIAAATLRFPFAETQVWHAFTNWLAS